MSPLSPAVAEHLATVIPPLAAALHRDCKTLPAGDIAQAAWERALERSEWFAKQLEQGHVGLIREELRRAAWRACKDEERYQRTKRAVANGYDADDEQFYTLGLLRALLPAFFDGGVAEEPPKTRGGRGGSLKSERGDYLTMMVDIGAGMEKIAPHERRSLEQWFSLPQGDDSSGRSYRSQFASSQGMTLAAMEQRVTRALRSLQKALGGDNPWRRAPMTYETTVASGRTAPGQPSRVRRRQLALVA